MMRTDTNVEGNSKASNISVNSLTHHSSSCKLPFIIDRRVYNLFVCAMIISEVVVSNSYLE
jgi:hypothetical protein